MWVNRWDLNMQHCVAALQASPPSGLRRLERNRTNWLQRLQPISSLCRDSGEQNAFSEDLKTLPAGKDWCPCQEKSLDECNENWNWRKQMAGEEFQPGSLCGALGLKFDLNFFFFFLTKLGKGREKGEGKQGERIPRSNCLLIFFLFECSKCCKLQYCLLVWIFRDQ